jgi:hypothetical protein
MNNDVRCLANRGLNLSPRLAIGLAAWLTSTTCWSQTVPSLTQTGSIFTLAIPYFEYSAGAQKQALSASNLSEFTLKGSSVKSVSVLADVLAPASITAFPGG